MKLEALRTPESRFATLPGHPFAPRYALGLQDGLRLHFVDEGPGDAPQTFLCLHGQPTWSYLYRKMIPVFTAAGGRAVAPDLFGFGRSDKPVDDSAYSFGFHRQTLVRFVERLDLQNITLVCQDWGGLLGLTLPMEMPDRFRRLIVMNTVLATGRTPPSEGFLAWRAWAAEHPDLDVARLMKRAVPGLADAEAAAYAAPFPDARYKAGVRRFPQLVPTDPSMEGAELSQRAARWFQTEWNGPTVMAVGMQDPVLGPAVMARMRETIRGCPDPLELPDAGHFVQEAGEIVARAALEAFGESP